MRLSRRRVLGLAAALVLLAAVVAVIVVLRRPPVEVPERPPPLVDYEIVYVRQPRPADRAAIWPEVFRPARAEPGSDLVLLRPDGGEEVLVEAGPGAVTDPFVSFDGEWVYFSLFHDLRPERLNRQREDLPLDGADIFRIHLPSRRIERLTFGEFTPNTGAGNWDPEDPVAPGPDYDRLGYGILNLGPCPLPGGRIVFTSNRNGFEPPKGYTAPTLQLFVMDEDGANVTPIAPMSISSALHPTVLQDGRIMYSSHESQGLRDRRNWGLWYIQPDGRQWGPLLSAFQRGQAFHFMTQMGDSDIVVEDYYNANNSGFGALYRFPVLGPDDRPHFHSAFREDNPPIERTIGTGQVYPFRMPFTPMGLTAVTPMTHADDHPAPPGPDGRRVGKFTHPSAAPRGDLLVVWAPGAAHQKGEFRDSRDDAGIYLIAAGVPVWRPDELVLIKNDPRYNEAWPRAVVPYRAVHGIDEPAELPWLPNDGSVHAELPVGTPYGLVGTSTFYRRESFPGRGAPEIFDGLDPFNSTAVGESGNWDTQGAEAGRYDDDDIWAVRLLAMEPNSHRSYGPNEGRRFSSFASERLRILGEIPLRKRDAAGREVRDPDGNPDTSFLARIPADTPFTFQTLDRDGLVLNMSQTWHQVRPGEMRADCGGCHAHSQEPLPFEKTAAASPGYEVWDLTQTTPLVAPAGGGEPDLEVIESGSVDVEFYRDIRPVLERSCVPCHSVESLRPPADLVLDDRTLDQGLPGDYLRLARDERARWGRPPLNELGMWVGTNASRYVRKFQSRRSLLVWKVFGRRLDGWSNEDHPSARVPGDPSSLPDGAHPNDADLDFDGQACPPPGSGAPPLSAAEKLAIARWIDLGAPIDAGPRGERDGYGWFLDDLRPTLAVSSPRPGWQAGPLREIRIGVADAYSGVDPDSLSLAADFPVNGLEPGEELAGLLQPAGDGILALALERPFAGPAGRLTVRVADRQGNETRVERSFRIR